MNSLANESPLIDYGESISQPATGSSEGRPDTLSMLRFFKSVQQVEVFRIDLLTSETPREGQSV